MTDYIQDGTGTGNRAQVDGKNRLRTLSSIETSGTTAAIVGDLYNVNTENIQLTSGNPSCVLYAKNTTQTAWVIDRIFYNLGNSANGSGDMLIEAIRNPTQGTLLSSGTATTPHNLNFGSNKSLSATVLKGAEGLNCSDGTVAISSIVSSTGARILLGFDSIIMDSGSSMAIRITPQAGNTSMNIQAGFNLHRFTD